MQEERVSFLPYFTVMRMTEGRFKEYFCVTFRFYDPYVTTSSICDVADYLSTGGKACGSK